MKIFVLGHTGMLGRYVSSYFMTKGFDVIGLDRNDINAMNSNESQLRAILFHKGMRENDVVINCMGLIKQKKEVTDLEFILVNSVFPRVLANVCESEKSRLIHITTDCVFSGLRGLYDEDDIHDPTDMYGKSKSFGEPLNCTVVRTSIIGEELKGKLSFIEWVKSNQDKTVNGFDNWVWNGITCLQFAKVCEEIIEKNLWWQGVRHIFTPEPIVKSNLVELVSQIYKLNVAVNHMQAPEKSDRSLSTIYTDIPIMIPTLETQLYHLYDYQNILFGDFME